MPLISMPRRLVVAASCGLLAGACFAQTSPPSPAPNGQRMAQMEQKLRERFTKADTNGDGRLTREEAKAMPRVEKNFDAIDRSHAGSVSLADIEAYAAQQRGAGGQQQARRRPGGAAGAGATSAP